MAHSWVIIIIHLRGDSCNFIGSLLQLVELLSLGTGLTLEIIKLAALNRQVFLDISLALAALCCLLSSFLLLANLGLKNFVFLLQGFQSLLIKRLLVLAALHLLLTQPLDLFSALVERSEIVQGPHLRRQFEFRNRRCSCWRL